MALAVDGLVKAFGAVRAVDGLSLRAERGSVLGLVGPSGAGKTTTLRLLARILAPDAGRILWEGRPLAQLPRSSVGYLPEERGLYPAMPVAELLHFFGRLRGLSGPRLEAAVRETVEQLELGPLLGRPAGELSRGNAQRVQLALACLHGPTLAVLDEPFEGLDPGSQPLVERAVDRLRQGGAAVVVSSHRLGLVERLCDRVVVVAAGRAVLSGAVAELRRSFPQRAVRVGWSQPGGPSRQALVAWAEEAGWPGVRVGPLPGGLWELRGDAASYPGLQELLRRVPQPAQLRYLEAAEPSLEDVYRAALGATGVPADSGAAGPGGEGPPTR